MTIQRVRAALDAATPGPWRWQPDHPLHNGPFVGADGFAKGSMYVAVTSSDSDGLGLADARAIVLAHDLMPELLALWEAAKYQHETGSLHEHDHEPPHEWCCGTGAALAALDAKAEEVLG